jgi:4-diphosphocytidyl-2-C-methyl-D-erythritol kinase
MQLKKVGESAIAHAPAKLNLFLEISGKRDDGFHEIETLMTSVNLYDTLRFTSTSSEKIDFTCVWDHGVPLRQRTPLPQDRSNLVVRALEDLQQYVGKRRGAEVHLVKRIPAEAGMGGASSDAAAALTVANEVWEFNVSLPELRRIGANIGSDVPFFLNRSPAFCRGRGEQAEPCSNTLRQHFVIVKPPGGLSTARVYERCSIPNVPRSFEDGILFNRLEQAARELSPELAQLRGDFDRIGLVDHQMTGSGTAYFAVLTNKVAAARAARRLKQLGWSRVFVAQTTPGYVASTRK